MWEIERKKIKNKSKSKDMRGFDRRTKRIKIKNEEMCVFD